MEKPYLQITLNELGSIPKVIYKGKEIHFKREVLLHWETDEGDQLGGTTSMVENLENVHEFPKVNRIEERIKGHATY